MLSGFFREALLFLLFGFLASKPWLVSGDENEICNSVSSCPQVLNLLEIVENLQADVKSLQNAVFPGFYAASCGEWKSRGATQDGVYIIRPNSKMDPFDVHCRFDTDFGVTVFRHDSSDLKWTSNLGTADGCAEPGCYQQIINYWNTMDQISAIINISSECSQSVVNNCTNSQLSGFSWWEDRNSNKIAYWDGSFDESTTGCACFLTGDGCETRSQKSRNGGTNICNCDSLNNFVEDRGVLTNKKQLPVKSLNYGDDVGIFSVIAYQLGFLECSGKEVGVVYPSEESEDLLRKNIHMQYYLNHAGEYGSITTVRTMTNGIIKFKRNSVDTTDSYSPRTGIFIVPVSGRYAFRIHLITDGGSGADRYLNKYDLCLDVNGNCGDRRYFIHVLTGVKMGNSAEFEQEIDVVKGSSIGWKVTEVGSNMRIFGYYSFCEATLIHKYPNEK